MNGLHQAVRVEGDLVDRGFAVKAKPGSKHAKRSVVTVIRHEPALFAIRVHHVHFGLMGRTLQILRRVLLQEHAMVVDISHGAIFLEQRRRSAVFDVVIRRSGIVA